MMRHLLFLYFIRVVSLGAFCLLGSFSSYGQTTAIPDVNFEQYLIDQGIDTNGLNGNILNTDAQTVINLDLPDLGITDLTGLEAFINLISFSSSRNQFATIPTNTLTLLETLEIERNSAITGLDLSDNIALTYLEMNREYQPNTQAPITSLDLTNNINLDRISLRQLASLSSIELPPTGSKLRHYDVSSLAMPVFDFSNLAMLEKVDIIGNDVDTAITFPIEKMMLKDIRIWSIGFTSFDISEYLVLEELEILSSGLSDLLLPATDTFKKLSISSHRIDDQPFSLANQPNLESVRISGILDDLTFSVDISQNPLLEEATFSNDNMNAIDVSNNLLLERLVLSGNNLVTVDVSFNTQLWQLIVDDNQLPTLDVTNNILLRDLSISDNLIPAIDLSQNIQLGNLRASNNLFTGTAIIQEFYDLHVNSGRTLGASDALWVDGNMLEGTFPDLESLVDYSYTNYFRFKLQNNRFHFGDFENQHLDYVALLSTLTDNPSFQLPIFGTYEYAGQAKVDEIENFTRDAGDAITLTCDVRGAQNHYTWFKDGLEIPDAPDAPEWVLTDLNSCDQGVYHTEITSDLVPFENNNPPGSSGKNLLLIRNDITLTVNFTPSCVTLQNPMNGATEVPINTGISWSNSPGACEYIVSVGTTNGGTDIVNAENVGDVQTYNFTGNLSPGDEVFVTIIAIYRDGSQSTCDAGSFTTSTTTGPAGCSSLTYPFDGATDVQTDTNFTWEPANGADGYFLNVGTNSGGVDILDMQDVGDTTTYNLPTDLPEGTTIYVILIPYNEFGNTDACAEVSFTTKSTLSIPACTMLSTPLDGATDISVETDITWNVSAIAEGYILSIGTTSGGIDIVDNLDVGDVVTYDFPTDLPQDTEIFVTVIPYNNAGNATECTEESFTTESLVSDCTSLTNPLNGATNVSVDTDLMWNASPTADGYFISAGISSGGTDIINNQDVGNVTTFDLPADLPEFTEIFVTITPYNATGSTENCAEESFTTQLFVPDCVTLSDPLDGATDVLVGTDISWTAATTATGYSLTVGTTSGGTDIMDNQDVGNVTTFDLPNDLPESTEIFVTVIPYNATGNAVGCAEESFTTQSFVSDCTTLANPLNGATNVSVDTDLMWNVSPTADGYFISVGISSGGTDIINNQDVGNVTTFDLPADLPEFTEIFVTITPYNATGSTENCAEESFTTQLFVPDCVTLSDPLDGATDVLVGTDISWTAATTATGYSLTVGTTSGGTDIMDNQDVGNVTTFDLPNDLPESTEIFVTVIPYNATGNAVGCVEESFTTQSFVSDCTSLTNPLNGATNVLVDTDLMWNVSPTADGYFISVGTSSGGTDIINNQDVGNVTTFDLPADLPEFTEIFVTITPYNATGSTENCAEESFTTQLFVPDCVTLSDPLDGATDVLVGTDISWTVATTATGYFLTVGTTSSGTDIVDNQDVGNVTTFDLPNDLPESTEIFVTVIPYNATGNAVGCAEESFTTQSFVSDCTSLTNPLNGATNVLVDTDLMWNVSPNTDGYFISAGTSSGGTDIINNQDVGNVTTFDLPTDLPEFTEIFVTITPYNATGSTENCAEESFTTQLFVPDCVTLSDPLDGATDVLVGTDISWTVATTATGYFLTVGTISSGTDILDNEDVGNVISVSLNEPLPYNATIYVTIIPYNDSGMAAGCQEAFFETEIEAVITQNDQKFGFSPDGDGINEFWKIRGIENYPDNVVSIYNRWGDLVFEISGYDNVSNVFRGSANKANSRGAGDLPEGTYFFTIDIPVANTLKTRGYVVIKR